MRDAEVINMIPEEPFLELIVEKIVDESVLHAMNDVVGVNATHSLCADTIRRESVSGRTWRYTQDHAATITRVAVHETNMSRVFHW